MATDFKLKEKVIAFFDQNSIQEATCRRIAEWIIKAYPNDCEQKRDNSKVIDNEKELASAITREISSVLNTQYEALLSEGLKKEKVDGKQRLRRTESISNTKIINSKSSFKTINTKPNTNKKIDEKEKRMYKPLIKFLESEREFWFLPIDHKKTPRQRKERGSDRWLFPDLVGIEDLSEGWNEKVRECVRLYSGKMCKLWSFELKVDITTATLRENFFQAVSNSSWANFGYLVACEINDASLKQLRILSSLHGIGFIKLSIRKPQDSQIMIPAQEKRDIDWNIVNKLANNDDFKEYIERIQDAHIVKSSKLK